MIEASTMEYGGKKMANFTITNGEKELSLTVDNVDIGAQETMTRADNRSISGRKAVTGNLFGVFDDDVIRGDVYTMATAMNWLQLSSDPYGGQF